MKRLVVILRFVLILFTVTMVTECWILYDWSEAQILLTVYIAIWLIFELTVFIFKGLLSHSPVLPASMFYLSFVQVYMKFKRTYDGKTSETFTSLVVEGSSSYYATGTESKLEELQGKVDSLTTLVELLFQALPEEVRKKVTESYGIVEDK